MSGQGSKLNPYVREEKRQAQEKQAIYIRIADLLEELVTLKAEELKILKDQFPA